ncbi:MAG: dihydroorotate dehydrogenase electron transfer subunit, partial [Lachnospiraceae bacterium]|nr:dihydroorotate dehydrogenase electron transfer subunit [Lachnospiraceae bacterium]
MKKETAYVVKQECIASDIYSMTLRVSFAAEVRPGQFLSVYSGDGARLLPRPISICDVDKEEGTVRLVYRIAGKGTAEFSGLVPGCGVEVLGPLGKGFPVEEFREKRVLLVGGGIGIPPLYYTAKSLRNPVFAVGYRSETYLLPDISGLFETHIATEDGSLG